MFLLLSVFLFIGCGNPKHNNKIVKTSDGKYYKLDWMVGEVYYLEEIPISEIDSLK